MVSHILSNGCGVGDKRSMASFPVSKRGNMTHRESKVFAQISVTLNPVV